VDELVKYLDSDYMIIRESALGNLVIYYFFPFSFSPQAPVRLDERIAGDLTRSEKIPEATMAKLKPLINSKIRTRGELGNELAQALGKEDGGKYLDIILDSATLRYPFINVGVKADDYKLFLKDWEILGSEIKEWMKAENAKRKK
jgi:hypothetical protein